MYILFILRHAMKNPFCRWFSRIAGVMLLLNSSLSSKAQTLSFLGGSVDEFVRRSQLTGYVNINEDLIIRSYAKDLAGIDSLMIWPRSFLNDKKQAKFIQCLPFNFDQIYNSNHPYGWNDGSMIPAAGMTAKISGGIRIDLGRISIQLQPELVLSQNQKFETFFTQNYDTAWTRYYQWLNKSDLPERFGDNTYKKIFGGQSSIRYNWKSLSAGISTENLWWGPGTRNALVMSDNAPGFLHLTFNTLKPVQTNVGSFEWQIIGGILGNSGILPVERNRTYTNGAGYLYKPKNDESRYFTGMVLSWQPKWITGLFVGFTKASYLYKSDLSVTDLLPLEGIIKSISEKNGRKASLGSLFARYVMPGEKAEIYMEYGRNDKSPNLLNLALDHSYPRAYVAGMRKLFPSRRNSFIEFSSEFTQMQLPAVANLIHQAESWYTHDYVRQGYTNMGQVIGAGIGPGSNSQMISIAWVKGIKKIGVLFERLVHNNDFYYNAFEQSIDFRRHWTDLSTTVSADWGYKSFLFSAQLAMIRSLNYEWWYVDVVPLNTPANYFRNGYDLLNFHAGLSVSYRL
jgi:hypothetical protein